MLSPTQAIFISREQEASIKANIIKSIFIWRMVAKLIKENIYRTGEDELQAISFEKEREQKTVN